MNTLLEPVSERLLLRQWKSADREPFAEMSLDPRVMEFFPALMGSAESGAFLDRLAGRIDEKGWGFWAVEVRATGEFAGFLGIEIPDSPLPFSPCVEIGWRLAHRHWGKGYATEGARAALRAGFEDVGLDEIVSYAVVDNVRSRSVMEKIGMRDTHSTFGHPKVREGSPLREHCLYRITRTEWQR